MLRNPVQTVWSQALAHGLAGVPRVNVHVHVVVVLIKGKLQISFIHCFSKYYYIIELLYFFNRNRDCIPAEGSDVKNCIGNDFEVMVCNSEACPEIPCMYSMN